MAKKVLVAGLDSVGKTSIIRRVFDKENNGNLNDIVPTRGIQRDSYIFGENSLYVWDLGGQKSYREDYLFKPEIFNNTDLIIYVIDVQDDERIDEAIDFLKRILKLIRELVHKPEVVILLHKADPDQVKFVTKKSFALAKQIKGLKDIFPADIKVYTTSIFVETLEYAFEKVLKELDIDISLSEQTQLAVIQPKGFVSEVPISLTSKSTVSIQNEDETPQEEENLVDYLMQFIGLRNLTPIEDYHEFHISFLEKMEKKEKFISHEAIMKHLIDPLKLTLLQFLVNRCIYAVENDLISKSQLNSFSLMLSQMNLLKVPLYHFLVDHSLKELENTIMFGDAIDKLIDKLALSAYIMNILTFEEFMDIQIFRDNGEFQLIEYKKPSIVDYNRKSGYSSKRDEYLQILQNTKSIIERSISIYQDIFETRVEKSKLGEKDRLRLASYLGIVDLLEIEFLYFFDISSEINDFKINTKVEVNFSSISNQLLQIARIMQLISGGDKNELSLLIQQL